MQLDESFIQAALQQGRIQELQSGDILLRESAYAKEVPIVLEGHLKVSRSDADGREILLYHIQSGESCIMSMISGLKGLPSSLKATAEGPVKVLFLPTRALTKLLQQQPKWLEYVLNNYHQRIDQLIEIVDAMAFRTLEERLGHYLESEAQLRNTRELHMTHAHIAADLGSSRVVISRLLKQMEIEGRVNLGRNSISLTKSPSL